LDLGWAPGLAPTNPVGTARARCRSLAAPRSLALARRMPPDSSTRSKRVQGAPGPLARGDRHLVGVRALVRLARAVESRHRVAIALAGAHVPVDIRGPRGDHRPDPDERAGAGRAVDGVEGDVGLGSRVPGQM